MPTTPTALLAALEAVDSAAMVVDAAGEVVEANAAARGLLEIAGRTLLEELCAAAANGREHERWTRKAVDVGATLFTLRVNVSRPEARGSVSFAVSEWQLTGRQGEVLAHVVEGQANRAIAAALGIKERTVEAHITAVFVKARVESRAALIGRVFRLS